MLFFLIIPETVKAEEGDQVGPQAQENLHDSSTDSCLTFSYSSNSPRPFPPSPVHSVFYQKKRTYSALCVRLTFFFLLNFPK